MTVRHPRHGRRRKERERAATVAAFSAGALVHHTWWRSNSAITYRVEGSQERGGYTRYLLVPVLDPAGEPVTPHHGYRPIWTSVASLRLAEKTHTQKENHGPKADSDT